jgi:peptidoglycan/LPS O-acetylase OafA/YrhL
MSRQESDASSTSEHLDDPLSSSRTPTGGRRLAGIEGLRAMAALFVLIHHSAGHLSENPTLLGFFRSTELAGAGLTLFFVLSGFLLYRPFAQRLVYGDDGPDLRRYFMNRALRIYPAYVVVFLSTTLVLGSAYTGNPAILGDDSVGRIDDPGTFVADLLLVQTFIPSTMLTGLGVAWSMGAEIGFYLLLPLAGAVAAALVARRWRSPVAASAPAVVAIVVGLVLTGRIAEAKTALSPADALAYSWGPTWTAVLDRSVLAQADLFGYGMLAAVAAVAMARRPGRAHRESRRSLVVVAALGIAVIAALRGGVFQTNVTGVAAALLITAVAVPSLAPGGTSLLARCLDFAPLKFLGLISYSLYLWHLPIIWWLKQRNLVDESSLAGGLAGITLVLITSVALACVTYALVERPALSLRSRFRRRRPLSGRAREVDTIEA